MHSLLISLQKHFETLIHLHQDTPKPHLLLGLSGGPDSVFLFHFFLYLKNKNLITFAAAHLDHGWRENSVNDAQFCAQLCAQQNIPFFLGHAKQFESSITSNGSLEELGRKIRRTFFEKIKQEQNCDAIALAHHAQDQEETFFLRLLRGSSLTGLCSIQPRSGNYIHPLLNIHKEQIITYLKEQNINYCIDPTNKDNFALRNKIRNQLIPLLKTIDSRFSKTLSNTLQRLNEEESFLNMITQATYPTIFKPEYHDQRGILKHLKNLTEDTVLQKRILLKWLIQNQIPFTPSNGLITELLRFLEQSHGGKHTLGKTWSCIKKEGFFWILKK